MHACTLRARAIVQPPDTGIQLFQLIPSILCKHRLCQLKNMNSNIRGLCSSLCTQWKPSISRWFWAIGTYCICFRLEVTAVWTKNAGINKSLIVNLCFCKKVISSQVWCKGFNVALSSALLLKDNDFYFCWMNLYFVKVYFSVLRVICAAGAAGNLSLRLAGLASPAPTLGSLWPEQISQNDNCTVWCVSRSKRVR